MVTNASRPRPRPGESRRWRERRALRLRFQSQTLHGGYGEPAGPPPASEPAAPVLPPVWQEQLEQALQRLRTEPPISPRAAEMLERTLLAGETAEQVMRAVQDAFERSRRIRGDRRAVRLPPPL